MKVRDVRESGFSHNATLSGLKTHFYGGRDAEREIREVADKL